ncbi:MAG: CaiB/BaiF CoA transferase family protein [Candidatus Hodarchaeota archaeon]
MGVGALSGIRVLDLSRVLAGPFCTMILADMGAEVIKIESKNGDDSRSFPPFINGESAYFININRGKKSITLNLKHEEGRKIFLDLVKISDVVVENFRPGVMERLGLGYTTLREINPEIIYAAVSGFGHYGPYKDRPSYDLIGQAMGGIMSITGWPDSPPTRTGTAIADILGGLFCCVGILSALNSRSITGVGQKVDIALVDSVMSALEAYNEMYLVEGRVPVRQGNRYEFIYPYDTFKANDGWVVIGIGNDDMWNVFCSIINRVELAIDSRFNSNMKRVKNHVEIKAITEEWTSARTVHEIVSTLVEKGIPCAPVYSVKDVCSDPHIAEAREMVTEISQPNVGRIKVVGCPIKMSEAKTMARGSAPILGQNTEEVLEMLLGLSKTEISQLKDRKAI